MDKRFLHLNELRNRAAGLRQQAFELQSSISNRLRAGGYVSAAELKANSAVAAFSNAAHEFYTRELRRLNAQILEDAQEAHRRLRRPSGSGAE